MPVVSKTQSVGAYTMTVTFQSGQPGVSGGSAQATGLVEGVRRIRYTPAFEPVRADLYGEAKIDKVYRGIGEFGLFVIFKEWTAAIKAILWPFSDNFGRQGTVGRLATAIAYQLDLAPVTGTPAATHGPTAIQIPYATLHEANDLELLLGNTQRDVPVLFDCLMDSDGDFAQLTPSGG